MRILVTHPGRHGDLLWALASVRALFEATGAEIDLATSPKYASLCPLIEAQPYIHHAAAIPEWQIEESAPITPREPPGVGGGYDHVFHLGYRGWPALPLPAETFQILWEQTAPCRPWWKPLELHLEQPWITVEGPGAPCEIAIGFTDEWFELKVGIVTLLERRLPDRLLPIFAPGSRWDREAWGQPCDWLTAARAIRNSDLFLGCNSALHVLACALGKQAVLMEPAPARHHPIFYPYGKAGGRVTLVTGTDGQPTFDSRHCHDAIEQALKAEVQP